MVLSVMVNLPAVVVMVCRLLVYDFIVIPAFVNIRLPFATVKEWAMLRPPSIRATIPGVIFPRLPEQLFNLLFTILLGSLIGLVAAMVMGLWR